MRKAYRILVSKPELERPLGRTGCGLEDNTEIDLKETGFEYVH
jgi:hypothetical protein